MEKITVDSVFNSIVAGSITEDEAKYLAHLDSKNWSEFIQLRNKLNEAGIQKKVVSDLLIPFQRDWNQYSKHFRK